MVSFGGRLVRVLIFGSCVMDTYESCQGRNAAALSRTVHLTLGRLAGVLLERLPNDIFEMARYFYIKRN